MQTIPLAYITEAISKLDFEFACADTHPGCGCNGKAALQFGRALLPVIKTYLPVHIVPFLLFKRRKFLKKYAHD